jgi:hypothetical protein
MASCILVLHFVDDDQEKFEAVDVDEMVNRGIMKIFLFNITGFYSRNAFVGSKLLKNNSTI